MNKSIKIESKQKLVSLIIINPLGFLIKQSSLLKTRLKNTLKIVYAKSQACGKKIIKIFLNAEIMICRIVSISIYKEALIKI